MILFKEINSEFFSTIYYDTETRKLVFQAADGIWQGFKTVPIELFHGLPTGTTAASYYMAKLHGKYAKWALTVAEIQTLSVAANLTERAAKLAEAANDKKRRRLGLKPQRELLKEAGLEINDGKLTARPTTDP